MTVIEERKEIEEAPSSREIFRVGGVSPSKCVFTADDGRKFWLDIIDGKVEFGGDLEASDAAKMFMGFVGSLIQARIQEEAEKIVERREAAKIQSL